MMNELKEKRKLYIDSVGKMEFESKEVKMQLFVISSRLLVVMPLIFRFWGCMTALWRPGSRAVYRASEGPAWWRGSGHTGTLQVERTSLRTAFTILPTRIQLVQYHVLLLEKTCLQLRKTWKAWGTRFPAWREPGIRERQSTRSRWEKSTFEKKLWRHLL